VCSECRSTGEPAQQEPYDDREPGEPDNPDPWLKADRWTDYDGEIPY
jgi:hypothetical protein